jgi:hypothetical protein
MNEPACQWTNMTYFEPHTGCAGSGRCHRYKFYGEQLPIDPNDPQTPRTELLESGATAMTPDGAICGALSANMWISEWYPELGELFPEFSLDFKRRPVFDFIGPEAFCDVKVSLYTYGYCPDMSQCSVQPECHLGKITICHEGNTLHVDEHALPAHLAHGDTIGSCETQ